MANYLKEKNVESVWVELKVRNSPLLVSSTITVNKRASAQCVIQCSVGCGGWGWVRSLSLGSLATAAAGEFSLPAALESRGVDDATLSVFAGLLPKNHEFTSSGGVAIPPSLKLQNGLCQCQCVPNMLQHKLNRIKSAQDAH